METGGKHVWPSIQEAEEHMTTNNGTDIEEMLRDAEDAEEPGTMSPGTAIGANAGMPMTASQLESAGYVYVYDTRTADQSVINRNMLPQQLKKIRPDGSYVFSTKKPEGIEIIRGTFKCLLHADDPHRKDYTRMGLTICPKDSLSSAHDVRLHMQHRHRREWETIEGERIDRERERSQKRDDNLAESIRLLAGRETSRNTGG